MKHKATSANFKDMIEEAGAWLSTSFQEVNALNVFPVPDGDTGTNMDHTMGSAIKAMRGSKDSRVSTLASSAAQGALMGARGNSGVILSQILKGLSKGLAGLESFEAPEFANALVMASESAYRSVSRPVEGTMLTVIRMAAAAAKEKAEAGRSLEEVVEAAVEEAKKALKSTPEMLPVLKEAGVVDAGGQGLCLILEGILYGLRGELGVAVQQDLGHIAGHWIDSSAGGDGLGYCTEFIVEAPELNSETVRSQAMNMGASVIVVEDGARLKVHLHTFEPDAVLEYASSLGKLVSKKVEDMDEQRRQFLSRPAITKEYTPSIAIIAVSPGPGLDQVFQGLGASTVSGGQSMNPSVREILNAIEACEHDQIILLPNNRNVISTAEEAARLSAKQAIVVPSKSVPQGISALMGLTPERDLEYNRRNMAEAIANVITVEITRATRDATINQVKVQAGKPIGLLNDELIATGESDTDMAIQILKHAGIDKGALVTIYYGSDASASDADALSGEIMDTFPEVTVEVIYGGQPYYKYILSVES